MPMALDCHDFDTTWLLSSDWELDALVDLNPGLDEGVNGVSGEGRHDGEDEVEEEIEAGVSNGLDVRLSDCGRVLRFQM